MPVPGTRNDEDRAEFVGMPKLPENLREEFLRWVAKHPYCHMDDRRSASLVQVFFSGQLANEEILGIFRRAAEQCRAALDELRKVPDQAHRFTAEIKDPRETWCCFLTLEYGIRMTEARLARTEFIARATSCCIELLRMVRSRLGVCRTIEWISRDISPLSKGPSFASPPAVQRPRSGRLPPRA